MSHKPARKISRRSFLVTALAATGGLAAATVAGCSVLDGDKLSTIGEVDFDNKLNIPPLLEPKNAGGKAVYDLNIQAGETQFLPAGKSTTWGVNGDFLGPTLRMKSGDDVQLNVTNSVDEMTTLHWHGMSLPASADGGPHTPIEPNETWKPSWKIDQKAATLWYHPHPHGKTEEHVFKGVAGLIILDDDEAEKLDLPSDYGVDDIPVVVQDRTFDESGQMIETEYADNGMLGDTILVNGTVGPYLEATTERIRLRILNGSSARTYSFGFDDQPMTMIGSDGGLLSEPVEIDSIMLSPAERAEVLVELTPGENIVLRSRGQDLGVDKEVAENTGANDEFDILEIRPADKLEPAAKLPDKLADLGDAPKESDAVRTREFLLDDNLINDKVMDMDRIDFDTSPNELEVWEVRNIHDRPHNFHVHDAQFRILEIDGEEPPAELRGLKDTFYTPPEKTIKIAIEFGDNPDKDIPYMFHCHLLWHEDLGMMGQFTVS